MDRLTYTSVRIIIITFAASHSTYVLQEVMVTYISVVEHKSRVFIQALDVEEDEHS